MKFLLVLSFFISSSVFAAHPACTARAKEAAQKVFLMNEGLTTKGASSQIAQTGAQTFQVSFFSQGLGKPSDSYEIEVMDPQKRKCMIHAVLRQ